MGFERVSDVKIVDRYSGKTADWTDALPKVQQILTSQKIVTDAFGEAEKALTPLVVMSDAALQAALRYQSGGVEAHRKVHEALNNMAKGLDREATGLLHSLLHDADNIMRGKERHEFAAPKLHYAEMRDGETPTPGTDFSAAKQTGQRQV